VTQIVLDASALLALLNSEPGAEVVAAVATRAVMSAVNFSEVVTKLADSGMPAAAIRLVLAGLGLEVMSFDAEQGMTAGLLRVKTRTMGLSLGDRACLALGIFLKLPVLTADQTWIDVADVDVRLIR